MIDWYRLQTYGEKNVSVYAHKKRTETIIKKKPAKAPKKAGSKYFEPAEKKPAK